MYKLVIEKQARKKLESIAASYRERISGKLNELINNPDDPLLDIKKLTNENRFRLRVGSWRIVFERHDALKIIFIDKIGPRGDVYK